MKQTELIQALQGFHISELQEFNDDGADDKRYSYIVEE